MSVPGSGSNKSGSAMLLYFDLIWPARRAESVVRLQGEKVSSHVISSSIICPALACSPVPVIFNQSPGLKVGSIYQHSGSDG